MEPHRAISNWPSPHSESRSDSLLTSTGGPGWSESTEGSPQASQGKLKHFYAWLKGPDIVNNSAVYIKSYQAQRLFVLEICPWVIPIATQIKANKNEAAQIKLYSRWARIPPWNWCYNTEAGRTNPHQEHLWQFHQEGISRQREVRNWEGFLEESSFLTQCRAAGPKRNRILGQSPTRWQR